MQLTVRNFGPIKKATVDFGQLTVIIGKNNTGKSYLAQLHYTILECSRRTIQEIFAHYPYFYGIEEEDLAIYEPLRTAREQLGELARRIKAEKLTASSIVSNIIEFVLKDIAQRIQTNLRVSLESSFGVRISDLINIGARNAKIKWDFLENVLATAELSKKGSIRVNLSLTQEERKRIEDFVKASKFLGFLMKARKRRINYLTRLYLDIRRNISRSKEARLSWAPRAYYIPAGRGGLLESYETVVTGLVSLSPRAPIRGLSMPPLPGMASQFYSVLLRLQGKKGPMSAKLNEVFEEVLQGEVHLRRVKGQPKSRVVYRFRQGEFIDSTDVIHAASMIKELAPIYLIVRELIRPSDFLIIEEPESHLHPGAQMQFARIIGMLVQSGVRVLITTHSDLLLREIGHWIAENVIQRAAGLVEPSNVTICWLKETGCGSISERIVLPKRGILEDIPTFDEIVKELYEKEKKLERVLE
jgi:predicted ATPase